MVFRVQGLGFRVWGIGFFTWGVARSAPTMVLTCLLRKYHGALYSRHSKASSLFILQSLFKNKGLRV